MLRKDLSTYRGHCFENDSHQIESLLKVSTRLMVDIVKASISNSKSESQDRLTRSPTSRGTLWPGVLLAPLTVATMSKGVTRTLVPDQGRLVAFSFYCSLTIQSRTVAPLLAGMLSFSPRSAMPNWCCWLEASSASPDQTANFPKADD